MIRGGFLFSLLRRPPRASCVWADPAAMRERYDVAVAGGGVRALAIARACAVEGAKVALFASREIAAAADERAWPVVRSAHGDAARTATDADAPERLRRLARLSGPVSIETAGCLSLATSPDEVERLGRAAARLKTQGVEGWMVPAREVAALSPPLAADQGAADLGAALYDPGALTVDPDALALALAEQAASAGADLFAGTATAAIERDGGRAVGLSFDGGRVAAHDVVLAEDAAAIRLIREGKGRLSLIRDERQILVTAAGAPAIGPALAIGDVRISRDHAGALTASGPIGDDALARRIVALAPALAGLAVMADERVTVWTGVDGLPQVGPADIPGLWLALGFGREALSLAIPAADHLASLMAGRRGNRAFEPFAPTRRPNPAAEKSR